MSKNAKLRIIPLGGMGSVTQNMYVYEYQDEMLLVDCGIGFPSHHMPGVDILLPDVSYVLKALEQGKKIVGMILTHGHDDHIGATPYILPHLPEFPIYGSPLTIGFAENRMKDSKVKRPLTSIKDGDVTKVGTHFSFESLAVTHSVPDTKHYLISTPVGTIYHGTDFKLDKNPVDNVVSDYDRMRKAGKEGVLCLLMDCLRVERKEWVPSESTVGPELEAEMMETKGKLIVTLMSSHIHRIQQVVDAAEKHGRKVAFIGRSVEQNVEVALRLNKLHIPKGMMLDKRDTSNVADSKLCLIVAGSQGQEGSSLVRAVFGEHRMLQIKPNDKVIFSADAIPGNEINYYSAIDELARNGIEMEYPAINENLHQSGHGSAVEQQELLHMVQPDYVMPIGGNDRHRVKFVDFVAKVVGFPEEKVLIPGSGDVLEFDHTGRVGIGETLNIVPQTVDGLGVGDVGPMVLSDRRAMSEAGVIVVMIYKTKDGYDLKNIKIVSRGFVFMREAEDVVKFIKDTTADVVNEYKDAKLEELKNRVEKRLSRRLYKIIKREPLIVPVIME